MTFSFSKGPARILIVDDSSTVRQQLMHLLDENGFNVKTAESGEQGLIVAQEESQDMLIVDVNMPGIDGLSMIERLRSLPGYEQTPVFVLTTESSSALLSRGKEVGATAWIVKPYKPETLLKGIRKVLEDRGS